MRAKRFSVLVIMTAVLTVLGGQALATAAQPHGTATPANCGWQPANDARLNAWFQDDGVNIRSGDSTSCASLGLGYQHHSVTVHCYSRPGGGDLWVYLTDNSTGVSGWSSQQYVTWHDSFTTMC